MSERDERRLAVLRDKAQSVGLSDREATELADLERGGPAPVPSKLLTRRPRTRPWTVEYWRGRALGPLGALLVLGGLLIVLVAVFTREPAVDWRIHEDAAFTFAVDYPFGWTTTPTNERIPGKDGEPARRVDAVVIAPSRDVPATLGEVFAGYEGPAYGVAVYKPAPAALPLLPPSGAATTPRSVRLAGLNAQQTSTTTAGVITTLIYAQDRDRLVVFFIRVPSPRAEELAPIFDHARSSLRLSEGLEELPASPRATPRG